MVTSLGLNTNVRSKKKKKLRYDITHVIIRDLSKIIKVFEILLYKGYVRKNPKHEPTDSYFYLSIQLAKCIMRADAFNFQVEPERTEITGMQQIPIFKICDLYESKSKWIFVDKKLLQVCSTDKIESESVIVEEISTEDSKSENSSKSIDTNKGKDAIYET